MTQDPVFIITNPTALNPESFYHRKESVELWKSRNETDVIVADHDVFGTDENDEDSLDSLLRLDTLDSFR